MQIPVFALTEMALNGFHSPNFTAMGILGKVFGGKEPAQVKVSLEEAWPFLEKEVSGKKKQLLQDSAAKIAEIRHLLREANSSLQGLGQAAKPQTAEAKRGRLDKIVGTARNNALRQVSSLLEKLQPENTENLGEIRAHCLESLQALQNFGQFGKNVAYAGISFRDEMKRLGKDVKQLNEAFLSMKGLFDEGNAVFLAEGLRGRLDDFRALKEKAEAEEKEISAIKSELEKNAAERHGLEERLRALREGPSFSQVAALNEKKASLLKEKQQAKTELLDLFAKIEKPLHRLDKMAQSGKAVMPGSLASFLHRFLVNPFTALKADPKAETLKMVLGEAVSAVESGLVELKEREREKKLSALQELLSFDFFGRAFWRFNKIDSEISGIERKLSEMPGIREEAKLLSALKEAESSWADLREGLSSKNKALSQDRLLIQKLGDEIQGLLSEATGKQVTFAR